MAAVLELNLLLHFTLARSELTPLSSTERTGESRAAAHNRLLPRHSTGPHTHKTCALCSRKLDVVEFLSFSSFSGRRSAAAFVRVVRVFLTVQIKSCDYFVCVSAVAVTVT